MYRLGLDIGGTKIAAAVYSPAPSLAGFELGSGLHWAKDGDAFGLEAIANALSQRHFWSDHNEINALVANGLNNGIEVADADGQVGAVLQSGSATISGGHIDLLDSGRRQQCPNQSMFTPATAND